MTTGANPAPAPTDPGASPSELSEIWRAIGRLEGTAAALLEGQRELKEGQQELKQELRAEFQTGQQELRAEFQAGQRETNRRIDRLFYLMLGIGGALLVSVYATQFIGG